MCDAPLKTLQRWWRRRLKEREWNPMDSAGPMVLIVEPHGNVRYRMCARTLSHTFICTARFLHPLTRRALLPMEVIRVVRALSPREALLLETTFRFRLDIQRAVASEASLRSFLQQEAGTELEGALGEAEGSCNLAAMASYMDTWADTISDFEHHFPAEVVGFVQQQRRVCSTRKPHCDAFGLGFVSEYLDSVQHSLPKRRRTAASSAPFSDWLLSCLPVSSRL